MIGDGDVAAIMANGDFDTDAVFTISTGPTVTSTVSGWFTGATESVSILSGELEANDATFTCPTADVANVKNGMSVVIDGTTFEVKRKQKLGTGVSLIYLKTS